MATGGGCAAHSAKLVFPTFATSECESSKELKVCTAVVGHERGVGRVLDEVGGRRSALGFPDKGHRPKVPCLVMADVWSQRWSQPGRTARAEWQEVLRAFCRLVVFPKIKETQVVLQRVVLQRFRPFHPSVIRRIQTLVDYHTRGTPLESPSRLFLFLSYSPVQLLQYRYSLNPVTVVAGLLKHTIGSSRSNSKLRGSSG